MIQDVVDALGDVRLQQLRASDLKAFYLALAHKRGLSQRTMAKYHAMLHSALKDAENDDLIAANPARKVTGKPKVTSRYSETMTLLTIEQIQAVMRAAKDDAQSAALMAVFLDAGLRKNEAAGLRWQDVDLDAARIRVTRQLVVIGPEPVFGPPKGGRDRVVDLDSDTVKLLAAHRKAQAVLKLANRLHYRDLGLVFAKEERDRKRKHDVLGMPLATNNLGARWLDPLLTKAGCPHIRVHDLRHCCAAMLIANGEPLKAVADRLGHKDTTVTSQVYEHLFPGAQKEVARRLGAVIHGR